MKATIPGTHGSNILIFRFPVYHFRSRHRRNGSSQQDSRSNTVQRLFRTQTTHEHFRHQLRTTLNIKTDHTLYEFVTILKGFRQTGDFDEQYCDKKIKQY